MHTACTSAGSFNFELVEVSKDWLDERLLDVAEGYEKLRIVFVQFSVLLNEFTALLHRVLNVGIQVSYLHIVMLDVSCNQNNFLHNSVGPDFERALTGCHDLLGILLLCFQLFILLL